MLINHKIGRQPEIGRQNLSQSQVVNSYHTRTHVKSQGGTWRAQPRMTKGAQAARQHGKVNFSKAYWTERTEQATDLCLRCLFAFSWGSLQAHWANLCDLLGPGVTCPGTVVSTGVFIQGGGPTSLLPPCKNSFEGLDSDLVPLRVSL